MPVTIVVPQLGESVVEGTIGKWLKKVGDPIAKDEPIVEIITDKINIELPAPSAGTLGQIAVQEGAVAQVGDPLGMILGAGESAPAAGAPAVGAAPKAAPAPSSAAPSPPPPSRPSPQPSAPSPERRPAAVGAPAMAGTALATGPDAPSIDGMRLSPAVRKLAKEHNLDVSRVRGSGMGGRITREDVLAYIESGAAAQAVAAAAAPGVPGRAPEAAPAPTPLKPIPVPSFLAAAGQDEERKPLTNLRKKIAENMVRSKHTAAHCATWDEVDMTALVELRGRMKERVKRDYGVSLTYMPFIMKAVVRALHEYPILNASMTDTEFVLKKHYNIGVAVHRDQGLIVPNVKAADRKTILQLAAEIEDVGTRARSDKLTLDDIQGGTFTITNAGMFGATASTPIINYPEVAILGVHLIQERPVVRDGRIAIRWMMNLVISFDHRLVDGTPAVQFLHRVKELLEDPESWLLDAI
jgi:2-oxoglutarate dehydrogenase E2 component (dihydrolipoamide succinyltransferase)